MTTPRIQSEEDTFAAECSSYLNSALLDLKIAELRARDAEREYKKKAELWEQVAANAEAELQKELAEMSARHPMPAPVPMETKHAPSHNTRHHDQHPRSQRTILQRLAKNPLHEKTQEHGVKRKAESPEATGAPAAKKPKPRIFTTRKALAYARPRVGGMLASVDGFIEGLFKFNGYQTITEKNAKALSQQYQEYLRTQIKP